MFGHVRLKPDTMVACNRQIGSLLNVMYPPPYGRQCVTSWWPIRSRRSYRFLHGFTNRIENGGQVTRKVPWLISYQLASVRPERYPSVRHAELMHTGDDPVMCGASHQWQVDRVAPWVPVRFRMRRLSCTQYIVNRSRHSNKRLTATIYY